MNISWYGHSCFKIQTKAGRGSQFEEVTIFIDPFDKSIGLRPPQGQADLVLISHTHHNDHNNISAIKGSPFIIDSPGEYSIKGIAIEGVESFHDDQKGALKGRNTIFLIESEDIKVCHLGDLGHNLSQEQLDRISSTDILMIPIGGKYTLDAKGAKEVIGQIDPKIIIPMHYKVPGMSIDLDEETEFCNNFGSSVEKDVQKINLKKKDIESSENKILLMKIATS